MLDVEKKIEEARRRAEIRTNKIQKWYEASTQKLEEATIISRDCDDIKAWHIFLRYSVGKNAKKMAEDLETLREDVKLIGIADLAPTPAMVSIPYEPNMEFGSRKRIEEDIMECLNDNQVSMIAICGAGGVGKTTMVQGIVNKVRKDSIFDEVVMVVVSQQIDRYKIQKEVAEFLGLKFSVDTLAARAPILHTRLLDSKKKLIIFDDVWEKFDMLEIGVPFGNCSCKTILTSRVEDACNQMNSQKIIPLEVLNVEEALTLFKEKAGSYVERSDLQSIAKDVAAECQGLPVALVTVGGALKNQDIRVWRDFLSQLRSSDPTDIPGVIKDVYYPLKLSYDFLKNESLKDLFLFCCVFPEDYDIPIELLTLFGIGLGIFKGIGNIEEGRNRTYNFVQQLKSRFLLMHSEMKHCIKMHDVIRDVAVFIVSKEKHGFLKSLEVPSMDSSSKYSSHDCNWMSTKLGLDFPNLRLLMILGSTESIVDANVICFQGIEELNVLSLSRINLESLPPTLGLLKKLRTLHLHECRVRDISLVGELANLEILCIQYCDNIEELPENIWRLNRLRFLELSYGFYTETVVVLSAISSLIGLEELKIDCFDFKWEVNENQSEEKNASCLTSLEMYVSNSNFVAQEIPPFSQKLVKYRICSGELRHRSGDMEHERHIALDLSLGIRVGNWIHRLVRSTQSLELNGYCSNNFDLAEISTLRRLIIADCSTLKKLVDAIDCKFFPFPVLEHLELRKLKELESIIDGTIPEGSNSFQNLKSLIVEYIPKLGYLWKSLNQNVSLGNLVSISIYDCGNLRYLFSVAIVRSLVHLQQLEISGCFAIEQVVWNEIRDEGERHIIFPELLLLELDHLPRLTTFCKGVESIKFPKLKETKIGGLERMNSLLALDSEATHDQHCPHFFCNQKVEIPGLEILRLYSLEDNISKIWCHCVPVNVFHNLKTLAVVGLSGIANLMSSSIAKNLVNLDHLIIGSCSNMVVVIEEEKEVFVTSLFPKLRLLCISNLPELRSFYQWENAFELPSLREVDIIACPMMETFTLGSVSAPNLSTFRINHKPVERKDLNEGIRDHFMTKGRGRG